MSRVASGVTGAAPIWNKIMQVLLADEENHNWEVPEGLVRIPICSLTGTLPCEGCPTRLEWFLEENQPQKACNLEQIEREKKAYVMPAILANAYMSRLASAITSNDGSVPITDSPEGHDILTSRFVDYSQEHRSNQAQLATLSLQTLSINPETPLIEILSFKDKNRDMLYRFRSYMRELARQVRHGLDTNEKQNVNFIGFKYFFNSSNKTLLVVMF